jgi:hypothetical protein
MLVDVILRRWRNARPNLGIRSTLLKTFENNIGCIVWLYWFELRFMCP